MTDAKLLVVVVFVLNFAPLAGCRFVLPRLGGVLSSELSCHWPEQFRLCVGKWKLLVPLLWVDVSALLMLLAETDCCSGRLYLHSCFCSPVYPFLWRLIL